MLRRKAIFLHLDATPTAEILDLVRDFGGMGYLPVPVVTDRDHDAVGEIVALKTGAAVTRPLVLTGGYDPQRIWDFARSQSVDLERSVFVAQHTTLDAVFMTSGVRRILRPRHVRIAA